MTRQEALDLLYAAFSPHDLIVMLNNELQLPLGVTEEQAHSLMLRMAIALSDDAPTIHPR